MAESYYVPAPSHWPLVSAAGLTLMLGGFAHLLHGGSCAPMRFGALLLLYAVAGWFGTVVDENQSGCYGEQVDQSFRWGMVWFIFSEVMFFGVLFGALFFLREFAVPWLGGHGAKGATHILWPHFVANWPLMRLPEGDGFNLPRGAVGAAGIPAFNTFILLASGLTVTLAHWGLRRGARRRVTFWLVVTIALGAPVVGLQAREYAEAYQAVYLTRA